MATAPKNEPATTSGDPVADVQELTVNEFCARLSAKISKPELIGAFAHVERVAGRVKDSEAAFEARFDLFVNQPA